MKTHILLSILILIFLSGCAATVEAAGQTLSTMRPVASTSPATPFYTATPTVGWESTAQAAQIAEISAQSTADVARAEVEAAHIAAAQITAQAEANALAVVQITQDAYAISAAGTQYVMAGTATAAMTAIPLTATAQSANSTAISNYATQQASAMTATYEAPSIMRSAKAAEAYNATLEFYVMIWTKAMIGVLALAMAVYLMSLRKRPAPVARVETAPVGFAPIVPVADPPVTETVINLRTDHGGGFSNTRRTLLPCTPEQFSQLVTGVLGGQSLAYEYWNMRQNPDMKAPFTRDEFTAVRNWLLSNQLAQSVGGGKLVLTANGESMFIEWSNNQVLPDDYSIEDAKTE